MIEYNLSLEAHETFDGEIELDESYFGGIRKGKRGRGAGGKTAVFGLLKRNSRVYTVVVKAFNLQKPLNPLILQAIKNPNYKIGVFKYGRRKRIRTIDPHHVKVVL